MKIEISQAQRQMYKEEGVIAFDDLLPDLLFHHIPNMEIGFNQFETDPLALKILTLKGLGEALFQLSDERPIRLLTCEVVEAGHTVDFREYPIQGHFAYVVMPTDVNITAVYASDVDYLVDNKTLVALYGTNNSLFIKSKEGLALQKHLRKKGYNIGDHFNSADSPLAYR